MDQGQVEAASIVRDYVTVIPNPVHVCTVDLSGEWLKVRPGQADGRLRPHANGAPKRPRVADEEGLVLTARAENHLRGRDDLDDTIARLSAYREVGADVVYAPALTDISAISGIVEEVGGPVNVLLVPDGPFQADVQAIGVRRLSVGNALARTAYGAMHEAAQHLLSTGRLMAGCAYLSKDAANRALG